MNFPSPPNSGPSPPSFSRPTLRSYVGRGATAESIPPAPATTTSCSSSFFPRHPGRFAPPGSFCLFFFPHSQYVRRPLHDPSLPRIASRTAGSERSSPTLRLGPGAALPTPGTLRAYAAPSPLTRTLRTPASHKPPK